MATNAELQMIHREKLYDLLILRKQNPDREVNGLEAQIARAEAIMSEEDVAWVEKKIALLKKL